MHQHPEAREQYCRLRNVVAEIQEAKVTDYYFYSFSLLVA
jgi:hypothetical protein